MVMVAPGGTSVGSVHVFACADCGANGPTSSIDKMTTRLSVVDNGLAVFVLMIPPLYTNE